MAARTTAEVREAAQETLRDYGAVARGYAEGNLSHDVSQNIDALLTPLLSAPHDVARKLDLLDVCCASGRDMRSLTARGHRVTGLDGVPAFCDMSRALNPGCEVLQQSLTELDLPAAAFDGIFANACLFHIPSAALPGALSALVGALRPGGVLFSSNAHGFGEDQEGWIAASLSCIIRQAPYALPGTV